MVTEIKETNDKWMYNHQSAKTPHVINICIISCFHEQTGKFAKDSLSLPI